MIHIFYGLPASGKTTKAMKLYEQLCLEQTGYDKKKIVYTNVDTQDAVCISNKTDYGSNNHSNDIVIIDGFFKTILELATKCTKALQYRYYAMYDDEVIIHVFDQNIQACLSNDSKRNRATKATNSITQGIEEFNVDTFKTLFCANNSGYFNRATYTVFNEKVIDYSIKEDYTIYSKWYYGNDITTEFKALDAWLTLYYPTITFLQYKAICKFINEKEDYTSDYYDKHNTRSVQYSIKIEDILKVLEG